ncbi:MAG: zinc ribbon domain-containing protein [Firmicutes bacterium]|nr:zinc ribbon domain-containing protein [Bacillota bacterium]
MKFCPYCGKSVDAGAAFCGFCGAALDPTSVEAPAAAAPPAAAEAPAAVDSPAPHSAPSAPKADPAPNPGGKKKSKLPLVLGVLAAVLVVGVLCVGALVLAVFGLFSSPQSSVAKAADKTVDELSSYLRENEAMATVLDLYTQSDSGIGVAAVVGDSEVQLCLSREELRISGAGLSSAYSLPLENVKQSYYSSALGDWLGESAEMDSLLDALEDYHEGTSAGTELLDFVSELEVEKQEKETLSLRSGDAEATVYTAYLSESQLEELMALLSYTDFTASDGMGVRLYLCGGLIRRIVLDYVGSTLTITLNGSDNPWDRIEIRGDDGEVTIRLKVSENSVSITADDAEWKWNTSSGVISALGEELPDAETVNLLALDEEELAEVVRNEEILSTLGLSGLISNPYTALTGGLEQAVNAGSFSFDLSFDYNIDDYLSEQISGMVAYDLSTKTIRMLLEVEGYDVYLAYEDGSGSMAVLMDGEWYGQEMDEETLYYFEEVFASMEADNLGELEEMDWAELLESELGMDAATIEACLTDLIAKLCTQDALDNVLGYEHSSDGESSYYSFSPDLYSLAKQR